MVLTKDIWLPTDAELTVEEIPLGTPSLRAGAMHLGKACEVQNNEFMLCRSETQDPRKCLQEGKDVTSCSMEFFRKVKAMCAAEFMTYATCLERGSSNMEFRECRKTQTAFDNCMMESFGLERPHYGYHCLPKPVEEKPEWMNNDKARKLDSLPENFPRTYKSWGFPGHINQAYGDV